MIGAQYVDHYCIVLTARIRIYFFGQCASPVTDFEKPKPSRAPLWHMKDVVKRDYCEQSDTFFVIWSTIKYIPLVGVLATTCFLPAR